MLSWLWNPLSGASHTGPSLRPGIWQKVVRSLFPPHSFSVQFVLLIGRGKVLLDFGVREVCAMRPREALHLPLVPSVGVDFPGSHIL